MTAHSFEESLLLKPLFAFYTSKWGSAEARASPAALHWRNPLYMINAYHVIRDMCCKTELDVSHGGSAEGREGREARWLPWPGAVASGLSVGRGCCQSSGTGLGANLVWKWAKEASAVSLPPLRKRRFLLCFSPVLWSESTVQELTCLNKQFV